MKKHEKTKPAAKDMPRLRPLVHMAQKMGTGLGECEILFRALPPHHQANRGNLKISQILTLPYTPTRDGYSTAGRYCREYKQTIYVGGREETAVGQACQQPDGTWQIVQ